MGKATTQHPVHPAADAFPMMAAEELDDLAADIDQNGLREPIVLTPDGQLLDGRNRAAACARLGIEPTTAVYDGDPFAFVISENLLRRHMTKGQKAMVAARLVNKQEGETQRSVAPRFGVGIAFVAKAATVLKSAPDLAPLVLDGTRPLEDAWNEAQARKKAAQSDEVKLAYLREHAPDLVDAVEEGRLPLNEAWAAVEERERSTAAEQRDAIALAWRIVDLCGDPRPEFVDAWAGHIGMADAELAKRLELAASTLAGLAERING